MKGNEAEVELPLPVGVVPDEELEHGVLLGDLDGVLEGHQLRLGLLRLLRGVERAPVVDGEALAVDCLDGDARGVGVEVLGEPLDVADLGLDVVHHHVLEEGHLGAVQEDLHTVGLKDRKGRLI